MRNKHSFHYVSKSGIIVHRIMLYSDRKLMKILILTCEQNRNEAMEKLIKELIGDRFLELRRYVTLDYASKIVYVDESSLKNGG